MEAQYRLRATTHWIPRCPAVNRRASANCSADDLSCQVDSTKVEVCEFNSRRKWLVVLSCLVLSCLVTCLVTCLVLSCLVLSCLVLSCLVLSCLVLSCLVLSCLVLSCFVLSCLFLNLLLCLNGAVCIVLIRYRRARNKHRHHMLQATSVSAAKVS